MDMENDQLLPENEIQGPLHYTTVEVPADIVFSRDRKELPNNLLHYIKESVDPRIGEALEVNEDGISNNYAYRGFVRQNKDDRTWHSAKYTDDQINQFGHEKFIPEDETELFNTTRHPDLALTFAIPPGNEEVGYLVIYDNKDGIFNRFVDIDWASSLDLGHNDSLRDRVHSVIIIKPEQRTSKLKGIKHRVGKLLKK